jgi:hypothetical protein
MKVEYDQKRKVFIADIGHGAKHEYDVNSKEERFIERNEAVVFTFGYINEITLSQYVECINTARSFMNDLHDKYNELDKMMKGEKA